MSNRETMAPGRPYWRILLDLLAVLGAVGTIAFLAARRSEPEVVGIAAGPHAATVVAIDADASVTTSDSPDEVVEPIAPPPPPREPEPDRAAIARAEAERDAARRERSRAEQRVDDGEERLRRAEVEVANAALSSKTLPTRLRDPRARLTTARTRGAALKSETDRLKADLIAMAKSPRPRRKVLSDRTPVARTVEGKEYHFEVRGDRVAFIDLERLVDKLEADAKLQIRLARGAERTIRSTVGPVGDFSLSYVLSSALPGSVDALLGLSVSYDLIGWEIVPENATRGETLAALGHPASVFSQVLNSLTPGRATITLWVYPDGFATYRRLKSILHERGFEVAARPLPEGIAIRGSPNGSLSAGQ